MTIEEGYALHLKCDNTRGDCCPNKCDVHSMSAKSAWEKVYNYGWRAWNSSAGVFVFCSTRCMRQRKKAEKVRAGAGFG